MAHKKISAAGAAAKGLAFGAATGLVAGILLAPKAGEETREDIKDKANSLKSKGQDLAENAKHKAENAKEVVMGAKDMAEEDVEDMKAQAKKLNNA